MALAVFHGAINTLPYTSIAAGQRPSASSVLPSVLPLWGMHVTPSPANACVRALQRKTHIITITATMPIELGAAVARTVAEKEFHVPRPRQLHARASHSMSAEKVELFKSLDGWVETNVLPIMTSVEKSWQPQDFLPEPSSDGFCNELQELKARSMELPDDYLVCLVGDMITEETLPTYQSKLNRADGMSDKTGARLTAWARWTRAWTAEENRHGDLLNKYLYLTGRVDMRAIEKTIQYLIERGMDPQTGNSPYLAAIYTSFQERATFVSHRNTARQAKQFGDTKLAQICGAIAADEKRHEKAYTKIVEKLFEVDTECTMLALEEMMRKEIAMAPARLMYDGHSKHIFDEFCGVAQKTGVYTVKDSADILEHLMKRWNVEKLEGLSSRGQEAQEYVCNLANRMRRVGDIAWKVKGSEPKSLTFSWIFNREVPLH